MLSNAGLSSTKPQKTNELGDSSLQEILKIQTKKTNSSKQFKSEATLVNLFESTFSNNKQTRNFCLLREFDCSNGIADLMIYELRKNWMINDSLGRISSRWAYALYSLPYRKAFSNSELASISGVTVKSAKKALSQYVNAGYCIKKPNEKKWIKIKQPRPIANRIIAIEAKLRNWRRALSQANRYQEYANQSWVILDNYTIKSAVDNIDRFRRLNIGLASISIDGEINTYFKPKSSPPQSLLKFWQANAEIANRINSLSISSNTG